MNTEQYEVQDHGDYRRLVVGEKQYDTHYSERVLRALIDHKGTGRAVQYLAHREVRSPLLDPFFDYADGEGMRDLRLLEVGSSFGHITERLNGEDSIGEIVCCDVDDVFVRTLKQQREDLSLDKVSDIVELESWNPVLPFPDESFDVCLLFAVVEHLPFPNRYQYVDEYWRVLRRGGYMVILDTPNRRFPWERHSVGLPFVHRMTPERAFVYAKFFGKLPKETELAEFAAPGTGWRNSSYAECLPQARWCKVTDVSAECGYDLDYLIRPKRWSGRVAYLFYKVLGWYCRRKGIPLSIYLPSLQIVFRKS